MSLRKTYVTKRKDSTQAQFRMRVPTRVLNRVRGRRVILPLGDLTVTTTFGNVVSFSLRTNDQKLAQRRERAAREALQNIFDAAEQGPQQLDHRQLVALSGDVYRLYVEIYERDPGTTFQWAAHKAFARAAMEGRLKASAIVPGQIARDEVDQASNIFGDDLTAGVNALPPGEPYEALEARFGLLADWALSQRGIELDPDTRRKFMVQVASASIDAGWRLKRAAAGDYTPDPRAARFPPFETKDSSVTLQSLLEGWWTEAAAVGRKQSTYEAYSGTIETLSAFLKHDDARRITEADILRFKTHRLTEVSPKTVRDKDLAGLKSLFRWGVSNRKLTSNPVENVTVLRGKRRRTRSPGFTDHEAAEILSRSFNYRPEGNEGAHSVAAKRWLPWLCAYTGARIGELAQLRTQDVFLDAETWCLRITPEAGTVKTDQARVVPIHQHMIDQGFLDFVRGRRDGPLFADGTRVDGKPVGSESLVNRLRDWVRAIVPDPNVQPNHAWRHRLKTQFRDLRIEQRVADVIQGWSEEDSNNAGSGYGEVSLKAKADAIKAIPRYQVEQTVRNAVRRDAACPTVS
ncbi:MULTISPECIES: phage integrase N-terminal SAM-like domain-containing protein [unclassified Bradyrhizobium]|uniref:phage integrase N-terminal SAM-like domain-containing protein n=1 Tax=unclassified Bradyrhizobium TaxID=2631580 RepID=UPI0029162FEC|nr:MULTISPECIES: phage integrase N-terminal SAM-like domain-containing protein [unclassified Bradyrhizobium]